MLLVRVQGTGWGYLDAKKSGNDLNLFVDGSAAPSPFNMHVFTNFFTGYSTITWTFIGMSFTDAKLNDKLNACFYIKQGAT
jgi:hypothetical protein